MIRVGRIKNCNDYLNYLGFEPITVMTKSSKYGSLGPYVLKDKKGRIMENIWQFSKVYPAIPKSKQYYSAWDRSVIWDYHAEKHVDPITKNLLPKYFKWRELGMMSPYPIRYPVGNGKAKSTCLYSKENDQGFILKDKLDYIARKEIYLPIYSNLVRKQPQYKELLKKLKNGVNLLILEVDGPHQESLSYYKQKYKEL